jgi:hypothetical protein
MAKGKDRDGRLEAQPGRVCWSSSTCTRNPESLILSTTFRGHHSLPAMAAFPQTADGLRRRAGVYDSKMAASALAAGKTFAVAVFFFCRKVLEVAEADSLFGFLAHALALCRSERRIRLPIRSRFLPLTISTPGRLQPSMDAATAQPTRQSNQ